MDSKTYNTIFDMYPYCQQNTKINQELDDFNLSITNLGNFLNLFIT